MGGSVRFGSYEVDSFISKDIHIWLCVEFVIMRSVNMMNISVCNELMT